MSPERPADSGPSGLAEASKEGSGEKGPKERGEQVSERRRCRRYRMSMPAWLSYGRNFREVESGLVRDISRSGIFVITEGGKELQIGDVVKVNVTFTVRGEARVTRLEPQDSGAQGVGLEFAEKLELDI